MDRKRLMKKFFASVRIGSVLSVALFVGFVFVATVFGEDSLPKPDATVVGGLPLSDGVPAAAVSKLLKQIVFYVGILAVISLTWGGFLFLTSAGDDEKAKKAKSIVQYSLIGVILSISAYSIVDFVNKLAV